MRARPPTTADAKKARFAHAIPGPESDTHAAEAAGHLMGKLSAFTIAGPLATKLPAPSKLAERLRSEAGNRFVR
jgi:hypothetical protein